MRTGTIRIQHRNRLRPRSQGSSARPHNILPSKAEPNDAPVRLTSAEIRASARNLRELVLWDLREEGYTFRELGELFRMTRQRASQIERKMILRASARALKRTPSSLRPQLKSICISSGTWIRTITRQEFEDRLASINRFYHDQFSRIIERGYKRQRLPDQRGGAREASEFWRTWPLIAAYEQRPFCISKLVADFPQLASESHLPQLLSRLRRTGLLRKVGTTKVAGHNHPEVLMAEAPIEQHVASTIERLVARWSDKLRRLQVLRRPNRPNRSIALTRQYLIDKLIGEGVPAGELEEVFGSDGTGANLVQSNSI